MRMAPGKRVTCGEERFITLSSADAMLDLNNDYLHFHSVS